MNPNELNPLIDTLLDGEISEADFIRLEAEFLVSPEARQSYYERLKLNALLETDAGQAAEADEIVDFPRRNFHLNPFAAAAAVVVALGASALIGWVVGARPDTAVQTPEDKEPVASGYGVVAEAADVAWRGPTLLGRGDLLPAGELQLESGIVKLDLFSGVTVIIEGAAQFEVLSSVEMQVAHGKVRALVPEHAEGFRIGTANGELIDLGTEFSMDVTAEHTDLHVLDGKIEWNPKSAGMQPLDEGDAIRWAADGTSTHLKLESKSVADLERALAMRRNLRRQAWLNHVEQQKRNPRLLAYFPMNQRGGWQRTLVDESKGARNGTIVLAKRAPDRWNQPNAALDFSPTGSRARLVLPGTHRSLTFVCWAKIDSLDRLFNSLFLTDGHELNEPHWQIMDDGRLFFAVKKRDWVSKSQPDKHIFYSPPIWDQSKSGKWMQIATVYDVDARQVTHYIDGQAISSETVPNGYLVENVRIGAALIGNWGEPRYAKNPNFAIRNLNGSIDEFSLYGAALTSDEISKLYQIGKP